MMFSPTVTTLRLLHAYSSRRLGPSSAVRERRVSLGPQGDFASLFEPKHPPLQTIVLVHGVTGRADADPSLVQLARALAKLGYRCVAPALRQLSEFRHDPRDIETVVDALILAHELAKTKVGVFGFSYGASYALCAAADPRSCHTCSALVGFGAYFELLDALAHQRKLLVARPNPAEDSADIAYLRYTLLASHREELGFSADAWQEIHSMLVDFTSSRPIDESLAPLLRHARHVDYVGLMDSYMQRKLAPLLSPAGRLATARCSVGLLHDPLDRFIPPDHAERLRQELDARVGCPKTAILTTRMMSHVQVNPMRRLIDLPRLIGLLKPVLVG